jgi:hypothetical protein
VGAVLGRVSDHLGSFLIGLSRHCESFRDRYVRYLFSIPMTRPRFRHLENPARADGAVTPTPERRTHGVVERLDRPIADDSGRPARPYRAVDTLAAMERRGSITPAMRQAGEDFRARFATAQLDPLTAFDLSRPRTGGQSRPGAGDEPGLRIENARDAVWLAILAVGGLSSAGGSCLWHVIGWERSLKEWALEQGWGGRRVSQEAASGILIAALGALEAHFARAGNCGIDIC